MFRRKGWSARLERMNHFERLAEVRALKNARGFVFEREEKLAFLGQLLSPPRQDRWSTHGLLTA